MSLTAKLAERALRPVDLATADHLRMLTTSNIAAGKGRLGRAGEMLSMLRRSVGESAAETAFVAAIALHARTQDDFYPHGRVHVGAITLAATLALADEAEDRLLECLAAGYDTMCLAAESGSSHTQARGLRPSGIFGPLGAAASAATALGLDEHGVANAIGMASALAGGTNQAWLSGTDEWMFVVAQAARTGVEAALLTRAGVTASPQALEGDAGWGAAYLGDKGLGAMNQVLEDESPRAHVVAAKAYPVSGIAQLVAQLACDAHAARGAPPTAVVVRLAEPETRYPGTMNAGPFRSRADALMSVPFAVACGLAHGIIRLSHLEAPSDAGVDDLLAKIAVESDATLAEAEASLVLDRAGEGTIEKKIGGDLMFPTWNELRADSECLARRSEASLSTVQDAYTALAADRPDARALRKLLLEEL